MRYPIDDATYQAIIGALEAGHFLDTAAALAGVSTARLRAWIRAGAQPESEWHAFATDVRRAIAKSESEVLGYLRDAAEAGDLKAATWWLERRHPERWGAKIQHIVRQEVDGILERIESLEPELGAEIVDRVLAAVAGERGPGESEATTPPREGLH